VPTNNTSISACDRASGAPDRQGMWAIAGSDGRDAGAGYTSSSPIMCTSSAAIGSAGSNGLWCPITLELGAAPPAWCREPSRPQAPGTTDQVLGTVERRSAAPPERKRASATPARWIESWTHPLGPGSIGPLRRFSRELDTTPGHPRLRGWLIARVGLLKVPVS